MRIFGINIPDNKHILISLTHIYGIGLSIAKSICIKSNISIYKLTKNLSNCDIDNLKLEISKYTIEGDLKRDISLNIKRLIDINSYRGLRHKKKLPVRGQRTRTNAKTIKKNKNIKV
ncbi:30S ribosomal protein S13 [endosymbiont of Sipalinus gigas]|uniref:30S ribosomal protein S13 n=1 Tax=endosymbiont of Sipalinus gigas TaxID=1972134 RepID=UPI000DC6F5D1|nr:30S ribosomal protein S13 [endosymbiont of Sipalinus gigas]BBA85244.1 30S ribosomal protein S13 [endosymbiont of Sipalinus gigas]